MDPFSLYNVIAKEIAVLDGVASLHLPSKAVGDIREIEVKQRGGGGGMRIDGRAPSVHFMNDIEEDREYARWPKTVQAGRKQCYFTMLPPPDTNPDPDCACLPASRPFYSPTGPVSSTS